MASALAHAVSIRSRPEERLKPRPTLPCVSSVECFNPQPPRRTAETSCTRLQTSCCDCFNPQPPRRTAETGTHAAGIVSAPVSIRSRPEERLKLTPSPPAWARRLVSIRSRPEERLKPLLRRVRARPPLVSIRSRPEERLKRPLSNPHHVPPKSFNPQPPRRTAETTIRLQHKHPNYVSIRSRPEERLKLRTDALPVVSSAFQSAAAPKNG